MSRTHAVCSFAGHSGYLIHPKKTGADAPVALGHTAYVAPWRDGDMHLHEVADELFILLQGELHFLIGDSTLTLQAREVLLVRAGVAHAIIGGTGPIEHFGLRAPAVGDRRGLGKLPRTLPPLSGDQPRELRQEWGYRIPLSEGRNQNCWLLGAGVARFDCGRLSLAYGRFETDGAAAAFQDREQFHAHIGSTEYYVVLTGGQTVQMERYRVQLVAGRLLEVLPAVCHRITARQSPFEGFTFRVPLTLEDKTECEPA
jgi:mannose-6-phosphate isomerase-like protein (cupin superfamily)